MNGFEVHPALDNQADVIAKGAPRPERQKAKIVAKSPDGRYQLLVSKMGRKLVIQDVLEGQYRPLARDKHHEPHHTVVFLDSHRFFVEASGTVDFYSARTGMRTEFLQNQFGHRQGRNVLLGFSHDPVGGRCAVLYRHDTTEGTGRDYWCALFNHEGRLMDCFCTGIAYVGGRGQFSPKLLLQGYQLHVSSPLLPKAYTLTFFAHITQAAGKQKD